MSVFSLLFLLGGLYLIINIEMATSTLNNLIKLHQVEIIREHLLIQIKRVQSDLYLKNTRYARGIDTVMTNVGNMTAMSNTCFRCHHFRGGLEEPRRYQERDRKLQRRVEQGDHDEGQHRKAFKRRKRRFCNRRGPDQKSEQYHQLLAAAARRTDADVHEKNRPHKDDPVYTGSPRAASCNRPRLSLHQRYYAAFGLDP